MPMDMRARQIEAWMCRSQRGRGAIVGGREVLGEFEWKKSVLRWVSITITALRPAQQSAQKKGIVLRLDENIESRNGLRLNNECDVVMRCCHVRSQGTGRLVAVRRRRHNSL